MAIKSATIDPKAGTVTIVLTLQEPVLSDSQKTYNIATGSGKPDGLSYKGKELRLSASVGFKNPDYVKPVGA